MNVLAMNPMYYGTFAFPGFMSFFFALGFWMLRGLGKEEDQKGPAGFRNSRPNSRRHSAE
jgi:hypothetical protein